MLDFIGLTEAPNGYGTIYANKQGKLAKPLTSMTLDEVLAAQKSWSKNHGSSAAGRYQFMRATLVGLIAELGLRGSQKVGGDLQDRLGYHLLIRRGYNDFMSEKISRAEFGKRLAQEWASFPVLTVCKGASRQLNRGQSYYAGDGTNKALVKPEKVEAVLDEVLRLRSLSTGPISGPPPLGTPIPGVVNQPAEPVAPPVTTPAPTAPSGSIGAPPPRTTGKTAAAAGIFAIITLTLASGGTKSPRGCQVYFELIVRRYPQKAQNIISSRLCGLAFGRVFLSPYFERIKNRPDVDNSASSASANVVSDKFEDLNPGRSGIVREIGQPPGLGILLSRVPENRRGVSLATDPLLPPSPQNRQEAVKERNPIMGQIVTVNFRGDQLYGFENDDGVFVALKPIVESMGVDWSSQLQRVKRDPILSQGMVMMTTPFGRGGAQEQVCLKMELVNGWLFTIDSSCIKDDEVREKVILYQRECYGVLFKHFYKGAKPASEPLILEDHEETQNPDGARVRLVTECRQTFGTKASGQLWFQLGLPTVPAMIEQSRQYDLLDFNSIKSKPDDAAAAA